MTGTPETPSTDPIVAPAASPVPGKDTPSAKAAPPGDGREPAGPKQFPKVDASAIRHAFESGTYPYGRKLARPVYEKEKAKLQAELLKVQLWAQETGQKFVILFEGRDAA
ncbi:MAG: polyphosphate kinase 2, partial [Rhodobacteraceae bacterium]|nr:polyphosphate kinase 2 [Paracoccaceae bacterium]